MKSIQQENFLIEEKNTDEITANRNEIISILAEHQQEERKKSGKCKEFIFEWENIEDEKTEIARDTNVFSWLYPIKFNLDLAIIIEAIQRNVAFILESRAQGLESIYSTLKIDKESFYAKIEEIQNLLIDFGKVKVCSNGTVILMNESCEKFLNRRIRNENKEIFI